MNLRPLGGLSLYIHETLRRERPGSLLESLSPEHPEYEWPWITKEITENDQGIDGSPLVFPGMSS
jgi:hypothetical protein